MWKILPKFTKSTQNNIKPNTNYMFQMRSWSARFEGAPAVSPQLQIPIGFWYCPGSLYTKSYVSIYRVDLPTPLFVFLCTFCMNPYDFFHFSDFLFILHMKSYDFDKFKQYFSFRHSFRIWKHIISIEIVSGM